MVAGAFKSLGAVRKSSETKLSFFFFLFFWGGGGGGRLSEAVGIHRRGRDGERRSRAVSKIRDLRIQ